MADIVVTSLGPPDRVRWAELWRGYLNFYETELPPEIYDHTWQRLTPRRVQSEGWEPGSAATRHRLSGSPTISFTPMPG